MEKIPQEKIDIVCNYFRSIFEGCEINDKTISKSNIQEFQIEWKGSKHIVAITEELFSFQDDVQNVYQSLDRIGLVEHLEVLDKVKVVWKKNHALLEEYY